MGAMLDQLQSEGGRRAGASQIRLLIADDHPLMLAGVRAAVERYEDIEVVGEARSGPEVISLIDRRSPAIVLMDLLMPGVSGIALITAIRERRPEIKIVILSACDDRPTIDAALRAGADAYAVKTADGVEIASLLRHVCCRTVFLAPSYPRSSGPSKDRHVRSAKSSERSQSPGLTDRERSILAAVSSGMTTAAISRKLWISEHTVKFHLTNIYRKLGVSNRAGAVRYAIEHDLASV